MDNKDYEKFAVYKEAIEEALKNEDDELGFEDESIISLSKDLMHESGLLYGNNYSLSEKYFFLNGSNNKNLNLNTALKGIKTDNVVFIVFDKFSDKFNLSIPVKKQRNIRYIYSKTSSKKDFNIKIDTRLNSMMHSTKLDETSDNELKGQIFVARLFDLVSMYTEFGDRLFDKNVRYSLVSDKNGVESAIHDTLNSEPENFWFYNNGITILADSIDCRDSESINIRVDDNHSFSVINGAQTITACTDYLFASANATNDKTDTNSKENTKSETPEDKLKKAYVLLRLIKVNHEDLNEKNKYENKISISLNRQKPIDAEDLAYNSELVFDINNIYANTTVGFKICRKGEQTDSKSLLLSQVARLIYAAKLQKPGSAKNVYKGTVLKMDGESFKNKNVFPDIKNDNSFVLNYGFVLFAKRLYDSFDKASYDEGSVNDSARVILDNSKYTFVSLVFRVLFFIDGKIVVDENTLTDVENKFTDDVLDIIANAYAALINNYGKEATVEYSDLKKDAFYEQLCKTNSYNAFYQTVQKAFFTPKDILEGKHKPSISKSHK